MRSRAAGLDLLVVALLLIAVLTLVPTHGANHVELKPFTDIRPALEHPRGTPGLAAEVGNVLLFMPLGLALFVRRRSLVQAAAAGGLLSVSIEIAQLWIPGRTTSFDDVILNTLGTVAGWWIAAALRRRYRR